jgi:hypothetical protein
VSGQNCEKADGEGLDRVFFERLADLLAAVRRRGVLHCDVARNVLRTPDGRPYLTDFGASYVIPWWQAPIRGFLLEWRRSYDERATARLMARTAPHLLTLEERALVNARFPLERCVKACERFSATIVAWLERRLARTARTTEPSRPQKPG